MNASSVWVVVRRDAPPIRCEMLWTTPTSGTLHVAPDVSIPHRFALYSTLRTRRGQTCRVVSREPGQVNFEVVLPPRSGAVPATKSVWSKTASIKD